MREAGGGSIVNTASVAAMRGTPTMGAYVASKAAVLGMTVTAAKDLAPYKVFPRPTYLYLCVCVYIYMYICVKGGGAGADDHGSKGPRAVQGPHPKYIYV